MSGLHTGHAGPGGPAGLGRPVPPPMPERPPGVQVSTMAASRRRRRLLLGSAPVALLALVVAVKLLSLPLSAGQASTAYEAGNADGTVRAGQALGVLNLVERYKAPFAVGDGHVLHGDFEAASTEFARALELVPAEQSCKVRVNLVLSLEKLGEAKDQAGDPASALELYARGSEIIAQAPRNCFAPGDESNQDGEGQALTEAKERLADKQQGEESQDQPQDDAASPSAEPPPSSQLEQLEQSGRTAQQERSKTQKLQEDFDEAEPEPYAKPW